MTKSKWARIAQAYIERLASLQTEFEALNSRATTLIGRALDEVTPMAPHEFHALGDIPKRIDKLRSQVIRINVAMDRHASRSEAWV